MENRICLKKSKTEFEKKMKHFLALIFLLLNF